MPLAKETNFSIKPFDGRSNFTLWQQWVKCILIWEGIIKAMRSKDHMIAEMMNAKCNTQEKG